MTAPGVDQNESEGVHPQARGWIERFARFGYSTKGAVYLIIGGLAAWAAAWEGSEATGRQGAMEMVGRQPFGRIFLGAAAVGLGCHATWRLLQALFDTGQDGRDLRGWIVRSSYAFRGLVYLVLMFMTATLTLDMAGVVGDEPAEKWTRWLLGFPLGTWLVAALGVGLIGVGLWQFLRAYRCRFIHNFDRRELSRSARCLILWTGRFGLAARGITFCVTGGFLIVAGVQFDASRVKNLGGALQVVAAQPYGPALLGIVAAGFVAYGAACFAYALSGTIDAGPVFDE